MTDKESDLSSEMSDCVNRHRNDEETNELAAKILDFGIGNQSNPNFILALRSFQGWYTKRAGEMRDRDESQPKGAITSQTNDALVRSHAIGEMLESLEPTHEIAASL